MLAECRGVDIAKQKIYLPKDKSMAIMYLSNISFTDNALISYFTETIYKLFTNSMKPAINSMENSADPDQLTLEVIQKSADSPQIRIQSVVHTRWHCEFIIINKKMKYRITLFSFMLVPGKVREMIKKFLAPCTSGYQGMKT